MILIHFIIIVLAIFWGCASSREIPTREEHITKLKEMHAGIDISDGVSQKEANVLAEIYFFQFGTGCGASYPAIDHGALWKHPVVIEFAGIPTDPILIHKITGEISWTYGPTIVDSKTIFLVQPEKDPLEVAAEAASSYRIDPIENDPRHKSVFENIDSEVDEALENHPMRGGIGFVHVFWEQKKKIL